MKSQFVIANNMGRTYPYVFTEQGVYKTFSITLVGDEEINNLLFDKISAIVVKLTK